MFLLVLLTAFSMAQEPSYSSYSPDPKITTCDEFVAVMKEHMVASQSLATAGDKPTAKHKEQYKRANVLQATKAHLKAKGVYNAECESKLKKAQVNAIPTMSTEERAKANQGLDMMQQMQACTKQCAAKHKPADSEMKTCMEACAAAVRPQP